MNKFLIAIVFFVTGFLFCGVTGFFILQNEINFCEIKNITFLRISSLFCGVIFEELLFRFFLFSYFFKVFKNFFASIFVQSLIFAFLHPHSFESLYAFFGYIVAGHYYSYYLFLGNTRNNIFSYLSFSIGIHFCWNLAQYFFSFFPDKFNFECSLQSFKIRIVILLFVLFHLFLKIYFNKINYREIIKNPFI